MTEELSMFEDTPTNLRDSGVAAAIEMAMEFQKSFGPLSVECAHGVIEALSCAIACWMSPEQAVTRLEAVIREVKAGAERDRATLN